MNGWEEQEGAWMDRRMKSWVAGSVKGDEGIKWMNNWMRRCMADWMGGR